MNKNILEATFLEDGFSEDEAEIIAQDFIDQFENDPDFQD